MPYVDEGQLKKVKFLSLHSSRTKKFIAFRDAYFNDVLDVRLSSIGEWECDGYIQAYESTISKESWKRREVREDALQGITDKEKCW